MNKPARESAATPRCCFIGCIETAVFELRWEPETPDNFTHSCEEHLGSLVGSIPDGIECRDETIKMLQAEVERLTACLNDAVSELARAALSEDFDSADCMDCIERINDTLKPMGKTSDWHILSEWYDRLCAACGLDNGDEIDILPIVEQRLRAKSALKPVSDAQISTARLRT